jgi:hypothetical protein
MDKPGLHSHTRAEKTGALIQTTHEIIFRERGLFANFRVCALLKPGFPLRVKIVILAYIVVFAFISLRKIPLLMPFLWLFLPPQEIICRRRPAF